MHHVTAIQCPACSHKIDLDAQNAASKRVYHLLDHATRSVLGLSIHDMGDVDLDWCDLENAVSWSGAIAEAKACLQGDFGTSLAAMCEITAALAKNGALGACAPNPEYDLSQPRGLVLKMSRVLDSMQL